MDIDMFLGRIGYRGPVRPDVGTLRGLHRAWRARVPYENLDIQLGRPIRLEPEALLDKLVRRRRGGFCFEMNGTLALLLRAVGFEVAIVEAAVARAARGDGQWRNHIALLVDAGGERWLADTGIGDAFLEPLPLREGTHVQGPLVYRLERLDAETWRMHHHPKGLVPSYDFRTAPCELADFTEQARQLSTSPESPFVRVLVAQHHRDGDELALRSRVFTRSGPDGVHRRTLSSLDEFAGVLADEFRVPLDDLAPDGARALWEKAGPQYEAWLAIESKAKALSTQGEAASA